MIGKSKQNNAFQRQITLIYGPPGVGKSSLAAQYPEAVFLATEAGLAHLPVQRWENEKGRYVIESWDELLAATNEAVKAKAGTLVIDTLGNAIALCESKVCEEFGEKYKGDGKLAYGKGAAMIQNEVKRYLTKLSSLGVGLVLIAHSTTRNVSTRTGDIVKTVPAIPCDSKASDLYALILGMVDIVFFCDHSGGERIVRTKPHASYDAKDRSGKLPDTVPLDYHEILKAWEGK